MRDAFDALQLAFWHGHISVCVCLCLTEYTLCGCSDFLVDLIFCGCDGVLGGAHAAVATNSLDFDLETFDSGDLPEADPIVEEDSSDFRPLSVSAVVDSAV